MKVMGLEIYELKKEDETAWDSYIHKSNSSTFYHQIGWRNVVQETYKHKSVYLIAKEEGEIKGILPLFLMRSISCQGFKMQDTGLRIRKQNSALVLSRASCILRLHTRYTITIFQIFLTFYFQP
jgi:hypothetical protein